MSATIRYLYHSGFAVETAAHYMLFDYWKTTPVGGGPDRGVIDPAALADKDVLVFVSHGHGDHFNPALLQWKSQLPRVRYIISNDIRTVEGALMVGPNQSLTQPGFALTTLDSTDLGVAFLIEIDGLRIYHAGDLNWWHWEGEPDPFNQGMEEKYKAQIALLGDAPIDLAFVPVDHRLGDQYSWGIDHLMRTKDIACAVPMHFGDKTAVIDRLLNDPISEPYRDRIRPLRTRGETFVL